MASPTRPPHRRHFHVAIICALPREADAVKLLFDYFWDDQNHPYGSASGDTNTYTTGRIGHHDVVLAVLPGMGVTDSAIAASKLQSSFTEIKLALLVGICGGVPKIGDSDAFLGDVVISNACLGRPATHIRSLLATLKTEDDMKLLQERAVEYIRRLQNKRAKYQNPGPAEDKLYQPDYKHIHREHCRPCHDGSFCEAATEESCLDLDCNEYYLVERDHRVTDGDYSPQIFIGRVGSGNTVLKSGEHRDEIAEANNIIAFEMEGAGIWEQLPCIVIKGICDYADSHKNKKWQHFAAATAAAVAKAVLYRYTASDNSSQLLEGSVDHGALSHRPAQAAIQDIPYQPNEDIVDRPDIVSQLNKLLPRTNEYNSAALWGLGGSGKTQIALDFAYQRCKDRSCAVFWVHADSEATFTKDYKEIARKLGINVDLKGKELLTAVRDGIRTSPQWVLILDNADDLSTFGIGDPGSRATSLFEYVPKASTGTVLWTSRDERIMGTLVGPKRGIEVARMTSQEAKELLMSTRNEDSGDKEMEISQLLTELQWLPLAISQAGAYMRRTSTPIKEYLRLLAQDKIRWKLLKTDEFDRHRRREVPNSVLETWSISINRIQKESKLAYWILHVIAYVDNQNIPHEIMVAAISYGNEGSDDNGPADEFDINQAVTRLKEYSFVHKRKTDGDSQSYEMHKLVQEATRYGLATRAPMEVGKANASRRRKKRKRTLPNAGATKDAVCRPREGNLNAYQTNNLELGSEAYFSGVAIQVVQSLFPWCKEGETDQWPSCEKYMAHALQVEVWADISANHLEISKLLGKASNFLHYQGRWREEERVRTRLVRLRRKFLGERHPNTIKSMSNLAVTYGEQGRFEESGKLHANVLELRREIHGAKHPDTIWSMREVAMVHEDQGHYKEAEALCVEVLNLRRQELGERHPDTISSLSDLGAIYSRQCRYKEAEPIQVNVMNFRRELYGEKHLETLNSKSWLAWTYVKQERLDEAEPLSTDVFNFRQELLGEEHPDTIRSMEELSFLYSEQGRHDEAQAMGSKALYLSRKVLGESHPDTLHNMYMLAWAQHKGGLHHNAVSLMQQYFEMGCSVMGPEHPHTKNSESWLKFWKSENDAA